MVTFLSALYAWSSTTATLYDSQEAHAPAPTCVQERVRPSSLVSRRAPALQRCGRLESHPLPRHRCARSFSTRRSGALAPEASRPAPRRGTAGCGGLGRRAAARRSFGRLASLAHRVLRRQRAGQLGQRALGRSLGLLRPRPPPGDLSAAARLGGRLVLVLVLDVFLFCIDAKEEEGRGRRISSCSESIMSSERGAPSICTTVAASRWPNASRIEDLPNAAKPAVRMNMRFGIAYVRREEVLA